MAVLSVLAGCATPPSVTRSGEINDPYETENRAVHNFNKGVDRTIVRPVTRALSGKGTGTGVNPIRRTVTNLGDTLETPGRIINNVLQGRIENAGHNSFRLAINLLVGVGGIFDPARSMGLEPRDTDFGETLHVWGTKEGAFVEVPFLGPSTERDLIGDIVDAALSPLSRILPTDVQTPARAVRVGAVLAGRSQYGDTVDDILYNSADSYAQTRLIYLQNRRFELARNAGGGAPVLAADGDFDPYADGPVGTELPAPYAGGPDPTYIDPYDDPYSP